jgi:hypothetical protein
MNVFVLSTGRCGSVTFARACHHIRNYTAAHESQNPWLHVGVEQPYRSLHYPANHIEVDNRLSWFLGTLEKEYGSRAFYVHLLRRRDEMARSLMKRGEDSMLFSFAAGILQHARDARTLSEAQWYAIGLQYWDTVNDNIELFLRDKPRRMTMWLHEARHQFGAFCDAIGAEVRLADALAEWEVAHNASRPPQTRAAGAGEASWAARLRSATREITKLVPESTLFLLADDGQWGAPEYLGERRCLPFLERNGHYWGPPPDDETGIRELERLRRSDARFLVLGWPAFWWLDHYPRFHQYLRATYRCVLESPYVIAFDLGE